MSGYVQIRETHSSVVFFAGDRVHKMKKPLDLGFLDNRTVEAREQICHREVELNRRLAPDVYLGVSALQGPDGEACEYFVVMRRLPDERRLAALVERGENVDHVVVDVARRVAVLHAGSPRTPEIDRCAEPQFLAELWRLSLEHLAELGVGREAAGQLGRIRDAAESYLALCAGLLRDRVEDGRAVDGHGDMLADDIFCLDDGARIIDCLEFDDELRYGDAALDVAFLAMDLERLGAVPAARHLLSSYREFSDDRPPVSLVHHYIAYRALVRAKVTALRHEQGDSDSRAVALGFVDQVLRNLECGEVRIVMVGGVSATGKTTVAREIGAFLSARVLRTDVIRKELAGMAPTDRRGDDVGEGLYSDAHTDRVYSEMLDRAEMNAQQGISSILDATWLTERRRRDVRDIAERNGIRVIEIECRAEYVVSVERIRARAERGDDASDATVEVLDDQIRRRDDWPGAVVFDTTGGFEADRDLFERILGAAPWTL